MPRVPLLKEGVSYWEPPLYNTQAVDVRELIESWESASRPRGPGPGAGGPGVGAWSPPGLGPGPRARAPQKDLLRHPNILARNSCLQCLSTPGI